MVGKIEMIFEEVHNSEGEAVGMSIDTHANIRDISPADFATRICAVRALMESLKMSPLDIAMVLFSIKENCWPDGGELSFGGNKDESRCQ